MSGGGLEKGSELDSKEAAAYPRHSSSLVIKALKRGELESHHSQTGAVISPSCGLFIYRHGEEPCEDPQVVPEQLL